MSMESFTNQSKLSCQYFFASTIHLCVTPNSPPSCRFSYVCFATGLSLSRVLKSPSFWSSMYSSNGVGSCLAPAGTQLNGFADVMLRAWSSRSKWLYDQYSNYLSRLLMYRRVEAYKCARGVLFVCDLLHACKADAYCSMARSGRGSAADI
jgi:hypothetical protein